MDAKLKDKIEATLFSEDEIETVLISNTFLFFVAGFDNSAMGMALVMYFLTVNPDVQERLFREIDEAVAKNDENEYLDYHTLQTLPYLDQVMIIFELLSLFSLICSICDFPNRV